MNEGLIPRRYAKALYKVAVSRDDASAVYGIMNTLCLVYTTEQNLVGTISNPFVSDADKVSLLKTAAGNDANVTFDDFLKLLSVNKRLDSIFAIAREYVSLYRHERGIYKVDVTSAAPLSSADEDRLKRLIESNLDGGSMEYSAHVDPALIGGFTVNIDNRKLDASVSNELKQLRVSLLK